MKNVLNWFRSISRKQKATQQKIDAVVSDFSSMFGDDQEAMAILEEVLPQERSVMIYWFMFSLCYAFVWKCLLNKTVSSNLKIHMEKWDDSHPCLFVGNHLCHTDYFLFYVALHKEDILEHYPLMIASAHLRKMIFHSVYTKGTAFFVSRGKKVSSRYKEIMVLLFKLCHQHGLMFALYPEGGFSIHGSVKEVKVGILNLLIEASPSKKLHVLPIYTKYSRSPLLDIIPLVQKFGWKEVNRMGRKDGVYGIFTFIRKMMTIHLGEGRLLSKHPFVIGRECVDKQIRDHLILLTKEDTCSILDQVNVFFYVYLLANQDVCFESFSSFVRGNISECSFEILSLFKKIHSFKNSMDLDVTDEFITVHEYLANNSFLLTASILLGLIRNESVLQKVKQDIARFCAFPMKERCIVGMEDIDIDDAILNHFSRILQFHSL